MNLFNHKKTFNHGIHPPEMKEDTRDKRIRQFEFAPVMVMPLHQHLGKPAIPVVREDQEVVRGQLIARADGYMSVAMHAPASGIVQRIGLVPGISGKMVQGIYIKPFPASGQEVMEGTPVHPDTGTPEEILKAIQEAGIVGLGGAAFPTHVKLSMPEGKWADTVIINGAECEPYLTTDHRVMLEQEKDIYHGIRYVLKVSGAKRAIIGIEENKKDAAEHLRRHLPPDLPVTVETVEVKYPQGAEKMLIKSLLNREVPSGGLPVDVHVVCINVATTAEIGRLLPHGRGIQERVITVAGPGVKRKGNYRVPIGTPLRFLLNTVGTEDDITRVFMGGPMMGVAASNLDIPITKGTSGVTVFTERETGKILLNDEYPCIRCAYCVDACPIFLNPSQMGILAKKREYTRMVEEYNLMDCFECGSCSYVCPSHIPLVQYFRIAKSQYRELQAKAVAS